MTAKERQQQRLIELYRESTGREPVTRFSDDPDWNYAGSSDEVEALRQRLDRIEDERVMRGQEAFDFDET